MNAKILAILVIMTFVFALTANTPIIGVQSQQEESPNIISEVRDLGWVTYASSNYSLRIENETQIESEAGELEYSFSLRNEWNISVFCGASLPVNLIVDIPTNATPGENITITVGLYSLKGHVFFVLLGTHYLKLENEFSSTWETPPPSDETYETEYEFFLKLLNQYMLNWTAELETPIGFINATIAENMTVHLGTFSLELEMEYYNSLENKTVETEVEVEASVDVYINFDVRLIANTSVVGLVNITGTAAAEPGERALIWTDEGLKEISILIDPNATSNDTMGVDVALNYVVHRFSIIYEDIDLLINIDESSLETEIEGFVNETQVLTAIKTQLTQIVEEYIMGEHDIPFNITGTELIEKLKGPEFETLSSDSNTITSESPYDEFLALYVQTLVSVITAPVTPPSEGITLPTGYEMVLIGVSIIAALIVATYIITRRNRI